MEDSNIKFNKKGQFYQVSEEDKEEIYVNGLDDSNDSLELIKASPEMTPNIQNRLFLQNLQHPYQDNIDDETDEKSAAVFSGSTKVYQNPESSKLNATHSSFRSNDLKFNSTLQPNILEIKPQVSGVKIHAAWREHYSGIKKKNENPVEEEIKISSNKSMSITKIK